MAENQSIDCPCSNIAIMQLFHELKQHYPSIPDQIVSKIIQDNCHDKSACETILQKESYSYLQSYPGAIISGNARDNLDRGSLCMKCSASRPVQQNTESQQPPQCNMSDNGTQRNQACQTQNHAFSSAEDDSIYTNRESENKLTTLTNDCQVTRSVDKEANNKLACLSGHQKVERKVNNTDALISSTQENFNRRFSLNSPPELDKLKRSSSEAKVPLEVFSESETSLESTETKSSKSSIEKNSLTQNRTSHSECDSEITLEESERSHSLGIEKDGYSEVETVRWTVENDGVKSGGSSGVLARPVSSGPLSVHNYQVAVQYTMQPALALRPGDQQRSFTTVNLSLRPPSSEPQPPIEIQSGQNLTYTTSVFDAKKGVQSQLQITVSPGGGGTVSACRTYVSSPHLRYSCRSSNCLPQTKTGFHSQNNHHLKALLEKQLERKDLLARELRKEKEKLRRMQNDVKLMRASIARKPSPHLLPKLKNEIEILRAECERLTAAVDLYSDNQNNLPLGETNEEFYRNIYTGQRLQREGSWSCQLCTFRNHPLLTVCEECEMPRISLGTQVLDVTPHFSNVLSNNNSPFCTGGGTSTSASLITASLQER